MQDATLFPGTDIEVGGPDGGASKRTPYAAPRMAGSPYEIGKGDRAAVAAWRQRTGTLGAKRIHKERAATSDTVNADLKTFRGLDRLLVRGV